MLVALTGNKLQSPLSRTLYDVFNYTLFGIPDHIREFAFNVTTNFFPTVSSIGFIAGGTGVMLSLLLKIGEIDKQSKKLFDISLFILIVSFSLQFA